ncbi:MAG: macro domain-containing protein [Christensenellales bacterium]
MITYHKGDLLKSGCNIICHQVNLQGVMGGGLAKQIADKYPKCEEQYRRVVNSISNKYSLGGEVVFYKIDNDHYIANCFSQDENFNTNYKWLERCIEKIKDFSREYKYTAIGIPKNYGCGIANGDWEKVESIWDKGFWQWDSLEVQVWEWDNGKG